MATNMPSLFTLAVPSIGTGSRTRPENSTVHRLASLIVNMSKLYPWRFPLGSLREPDDHSASERW